MWARARKPPASLAPKGPRLNPRRRRFTQTVFVVSAILTATSLAADNSTSERLQPGCTGDRPPVCNGTGRSNEGGAEAGPKRRQAGAQRSGARTGDGSLDDEHHAVVGRFARRRRRHRLRRLPEQRARRDDHGRSYKLSALTCGTTYTIGVDAYDAARNRSAVASVLAASSPCRDTAAPSAPAGLHQSGWSTNGAGVEWSPASDNVGVAGYTVYRDGVPVATTQQNTAWVGNLVCGAGHSVAIDAYDAAGNHSGARVRS